MKQTFSNLYAVFAARSLATPLRIMAGCAVLLMSLPPANAQTCATCPPGTVMVEVSGIPEFKNCTAAYDYYTSRRYEYLLTVLLQNESLYSPAYQAVCERRQPATLGAAPNIVIANRVRLDAESAAIPAVMAELIRTDVATQVPDHCRNDKQAQEESAANTEKWIGIARETYAAQTLDYAENSLAATLECKHFISNKAANIYEMDLKDDIILAVAAAQSYMLQPKSVDMKDTFLRYKQARDTITNARTAHTTTGQEGAAP